MRIISLYFATVRRASLMPFSLTKAAIASSLNGFFGNSFEIIVLIKSRTAAAAVPSPDSVAAMDTLKKDFSVKHPFGVAIRSPLVTRLTVLSCIFTAVATSFRERGFKPDKPSLKKSDC